MENKHNVPETYLKRKNKYNMELLIELNEEYRKKPYMSNFTKYDDESQMAQAMSRLNNLSKICDLKRCWKLDAAEGMYHTVLQNIIIVM